MITFKSVSNKDRMGFLWVGVFKDGLPVFKRGVHLRYNVKTIPSAKRKWEKELEEFGYPK